MTLATTFIEPTTTATSTRARLFVAGIVGTIASVFSALVGNALTGSNGGGTTTGLIIGTLVAGYLVRAQTPKSWVLAFGLVFLIQLTLGVALSIAIGLASAI